MKKILKWIAIAMFLIIITSVIAQFLPKEISGYFSSGVGFIIGFVCMSCFMLD